MPATDFSFRFTADHVRILLKGNAEAGYWYTAMVNVLPAWEITTVERVAGFIAQCAHESGNFKLLEENLNYSASALLRVFPRYFTSQAMANEYAYKPEKIANYVYMDENRSARGALGNVQPGDGWRFRGRGLKQLTGRNNYARFGASCGMTAEQAAEYVATKDGAIESACWFWDTAKLSRFADARDIDGMSRAINGGDIGLADRRARWNEALKVLGSAPSVTPVVQSKEIILGIGSSGPDVAKLQTALGIKADGSFGPKTEAAVRQWQAGAKVQVTGRVDKDTLKKILG